MICKHCKNEIPDGSIFCNWCGKKQVADQRKAKKRPNGTGSVYKLSGKRSKPWVAAKNKEIIGYYETRKAAAEALEKLSGRNIDTTFNYTFAEVYEAWSAEHFREVGGAGKEGYETAFKFFEVLHDKPFRRLRTVDYQALIDNLIAKGRSHSTVSKYKQLLTQMSKWAIREDLITTNYGSFVKLPTSEKTQKETFTDEEIEKLEKCGNETARIILMLLATGMRIGELFTLRYDNTFADHVIGGSKTAAGKNRIIPIRPEGRPHFEYFKNHSEGKELLLGSYAGNLDTDNFRTRDYYPLLEELGIKRKSPHCTRHTYASRAVRGGMARETLQKILGHSSYLVTADVYVHSDKTELIAAVENTK